MLADERSSALADNFAGQWLETRNLDSITPDPKKFPEWGPELRDSMKTETRMFFESILRENRPLSEFLDAKYTFLDERLAKHYGIEGVSGGTFRRVELTTDQRGGLLSQASILSISSYPTRTSPVIRGKYLLQNFLGAPPPAPPPDVPTLDEEAVGNAGSLRQQLEKHRSNATCASCHNRMDVLGFGLENYDAIGKWRTMDGKFPVDVSGTFPNGKSFSTPAEMKVLLKEELPDFARCIIEKMLTYSLGRGLEKYDRKTIDEIGRRLSASGYQFQTLISEIVQSLPFQSRRGEALLNERSSETEGGCKTMIMRKALPRRTFLKGMGTAIALPFLDAMTPALASSRIPGQAPVRMGFVYVPNGMDVRNWNLDYEGKLDKLSRIMQPLERHKQDLLVLGNLTHNNGRALLDGPGDHGRCCGSYLTGIQPRKSAVDIKVGISMDQIVANQIGHQTRFPSLELGMEDSRQAGDCDSGYSCAYTNNLAWRSETQPLPPVLDPRALFERLFGADAGLTPEARAQRNRFRRSILDFVTNDTRKLQSNLGPTDKRKLEEYLVIDSRNRAPDRTRRERQRADRSANGKALWRAR